MTRETVSATGRLTTNDLVLLARDVAARARWARRGVDIDAPRMWNASKTGAPRMENDADGNAPYPSPIPIPNPSPDASKIENLDQLEAILFPEYNAVASKPKAVTILRGLLPITRQELDDARAATNGKGWTYFAKVVRSLREPEPQTRGRKLTSQPSANWPAEYKPEEEDHGP